MDDTESTSLVSGKSVSEITISAATDDQGDVEADDTNETILRLDLALSTIGELRSSPQLTDVQLVAKNGAKLSAHRSILAVASGFFRSLFQKRHSEMVCFPQLPEETLRVMCDFCYGIRVSLHKCDVVELLNVGHYLLMPEILAYCTKWITMGLTIENCMQWERTARRYELTQLRGAVLRYISYNFEDVCNRHLKKMLRLPGDELCDMLSNDRTNIRHERLAWLVIMRWAQHHPKHKNAFFKRLLKTVRLTVLDDRTLDEMIDNEMIRNDEQCHSLVRTAYAALHAMPLSSQEFQCLLETKACIPRLPDEVLVVTGGRAGTSLITGTLQVYDRRANKWHELDSSDCAGPRAYHGTVVIGHSLYNIGGSDGRDYMSVVSEFNFSDKSWTYCAPMNSKRLYVAASTFDGRIYAFGGFNGRDRVTSAECFHLGSNQWGSIQDMPTPRSDARAVTVRNKIVVAGGFDGRRFVNTVAAYEPTTDEWFELRPMIKRRSGLGLVALDDCIYAVGGFCGGPRHHSAERYDLRTRGWQQVAAMRLSRSNFAIAVLEGKIFVVGGIYGHVDGTATCEMYETRMDRWSRMTPMTNALSACAGVVVSDLSNVKDFVSPSRMTILPPKPRCNVPWYHNSQLSRIYQYQ